MAASIALPLDVRRVILMFGGNRFASVGRLTAYFQMPKAASEITVPPTMIAAIARSATKSLLRLIPVAMYSALDVGCGAEIDVVEVGATIPDRAEGELSKSSVAISTLRDDGGMERSIPAEISSSRLSSFRSTSAS